MIRFLFLFLLIGCTNADDKCARDGWMPDDPQYKDCKHNVYRDMRDHVVDVKGE